MIEFQTLCEALFSLPKLENLKLILGKGFADIIRQPRYETIVYNSWVKRSLRVQLKSICLQTFETELKQVSLITQKLSFHSKARVRREYDYSDDLLFGSYGDDDDYACYGSEERYHGAYYSDICYSSGGDYDYLLLIIMTNYLKVLNNCEYHI